MGARGDVTMKFDAETAAFVQSVNRAREAMEAGASSARKFGSDVAKAGNDAANGLSRLGEIGKRNLGTLQSELMGALGGFNLVSMAIDKVTAAMDRKIERDEKAYEIQKRSRALSVDAAEGMGDVGRAPELALRVRNMIKSMPGMSEERAYKMLDDIKARMPGAGFDQQVEMFRMSGGAAIAGKTPEALAQTMAMQSAIHPELNSEQLRNKASKYMDLNADQAMDEGTKNVLMRWQALGGNVDEAYGLIAGLRQTGASSADLGKAMDKLLTMKPKGKQDGRLHRLSKEDQEYNKIANLSDAEKLAMLARGEGLDDEDPTNPMGLKSKMRAALKRDTAGMAAQMAAPGDAFEESRRRLAETNPEYVADLGASLGANKANDRVHEKKHQRRKIENVMNFLRDRGDRPELIKQFKGMLEKGDFMGADVEGMLQTTRNLNVLASMAYGPGFAPLPDQLKNYDKDRAPDRSLLRDYQDWVANNEAEVAGTGQFSAGAARAQGSSSGQGWFKVLVDEVKKTNLFLQQQNQMVAAPGGPALKNPNARGQQ